MERSFVLSVIETTAGKYGINIDEYQKEEICCAILKKLDTKKLPKEEAVKYVFKAAKNRLMGKKEKFVYVDIEALEEVEPEGETLGNVLEQVLGELRGALTPIEFKVFQFISFGYTTREICELMNLPERKVRVIRKKIWEAVRKVFRRYGLPVRRLRLRTGRRRLV